MSLVLGKELTWKDSRVSCKDEVIKSSVQILHPVLQASYCFIQERKAVEKLWIPKLHTSNVGSSELRERFLWLLKVNETFEVRYFTEEDIELDCPMNFKTFPFDEHICKMTDVDRAIRTTDELVLKVENLELGYPEEPFFPNDRNFKFSILPPIELEKVPMDMKRPISIIGFQLKMERVSSKYIMMYYIPTSE